MGGVTLQQYLTVSIILFSLGLYAVMTRRNAVGVLMGIELILNAANLNFVAFSHFVSDYIGGQLFAVFIIIMAASEAAVALAIILALYHHLGSINVDEARALRG